MFRRFNLLPSITKRLASTFSYAQSQSHSQVVPRFTTFQHQQQPSQLVSNIAKLAYQSPILNQLPKVDIVDETRELYMTSVLRKRRLAMKKHKLRKRRKAQRSLKIKLGK